MLAWSTKATLEIFPRSGFKHSAPTCFKSMFRRPIRVASTEELLNNWRQKKCGVIQAERFPRITILSSKLRTMTTRLTWYQIFTWLKAIDVNSEPAEKSPKSRIRYVSSVAMLMHPSVHFKSLLSAFCWPNTLVEHVWVQSQCIIFKRLGIWARSGD